MARHLSVATVIEKNRISSAFAFIPVLDIAVKNPETGAIVETLHFARNTEDLVYDEKTYVASHFDFDIKHASGSQPELKLSVVDYSRAIQARMQEFAGGVGSEVTLTIVNTGNLDQPPEVQEHFEVTGASAADYTVEFTLGSENPLMMRFPRGRIYKDRCRWRYKGAECGYSGPLATCDYTLQGENGCAAHDNTRRFGGFPGISKR